VTGSTNLDASSLRSVFRQWLDENLLAEHRDAHDFENRLAADKLLARDDWLGYAWPSEYGGSNGAPIHNLIIDEERALAGIPVSRSPSRFGINLLGPTLMRFGTAEQKQRFLPRILRVEDVWCQGYSEPEAGSDLANVQTFAEDHGAHLVLNGTKVWTTQAEEADWCFVVARTSATAPRHRNLSFLLVEMKQPGVEVRPLVQLTADAEFNEVFFTDARVAKGNVVGELGGGWEIAMATLSFERTYGQMSRFRGYERELLRAAQLVAGVPQHPLRNAWLRRVGRAYSRLTGIRDLSLEAVARATEQGDITALAPTMKLWWSEVHQEVVSLGLEIAVEIGHDEDFWYRLWLEARGETIYAGSSQIQRNIVAERVLGLPR
jgi:alkylation response protein AidB-like acyl-CoA dehydrogenase